MELDHTPVRRARPHGYGNFGRIGPRHDGGLSYRRSISPLFRKTNSRAGDIDSYSCIRLRVYEPGGYSASDKRVVQIVTARRTGERPESCDRHASN